MPRMDQFVEFAAFAAAEQCWIAVLEVVVLGDMVVTQEGVSPLVLKLS